PPEYHQQRSNVGERVDKITWRRNQGRARFYDRRAMMNFDVGVAPWVQIRQANWSARNSAPPTNFVRIADCAHQRALRTQRRHQRRNSMYMNSFGASKGPF